MPSKTDILVESDDSDNDDNQEYKNDVVGIITSLFPGIDKNDIKNNKTTGSDEDEDGYSDYIDDEEEKIQFNIIIEMDEINNYKTEDEYSGDDYATEDDELLLDDTDYVPPVTRNKYKKMMSEKREKTKPKSASPNRKRREPPTVKKRNKNLEESLKQEEKEEHVEENKEETGPDDDMYTKLISRLMTANKDGEKQFLECCNDIIKEETGRIEEIRKEREAKEAKKNKTINIKDFRRLIHGQTRVKEHKFFEKCSLNEQDNIIKKLKEINKYNKIEKPYKISIIESDIPNNIKSYALNKLRSFEYLDSSSGEYNKIKQWIDTFMKIPFGKYKNLPISLEKSTTDEINSFMESSIETLNNVVYGMDDAKHQIIQILGQWISNPSSVGNAIAIKGPMGTGKTTLVKDGISKILNRPFEFIALGGATDSSFLEGHSYTYEGSCWGQIVDIIIRCGCMNPVIYFDELDKISDTPKGDEIVGILTHLTDTSQNNQFHDKYFSNIDFDLSRVLFIFSYNDENKINSILKDRMYHIETNGYTNKDKNVIANDYMLPKIMTNVSFSKGDILIDDSILEYINSTYTKSEKGVRNLKRALEIIYNKINLHRLLKPDTTLFNNEKSKEIKFPFNVDKDLVDKFLKVDCENDYPFNMYT